MEHFRRDMAVLIEPGFCLAIAILLLLYGIGVGFLIRECGCL
jgi:hypothetical protein